MLANTHCLEPRLEAGRVWIPMKGLDLLSRESDERISVAECMVHEGKRVVPCECHEPERDFREVNRHRIAIHAVQAALCNESSRENYLVLISRNCEHLAVRVPRLDERVPELSACL